MAGEVRNGGPQGKPTDIWDRLTRDFDRWAGDLGTLRAVRSRVDDFGVEHPAVKGFVEYALDHYEGSIIDPYNQPLNAIYLTKLLNDPLLTHYPGYVRLELASVNFDENLTKYASIFARHVGLSSPPMITSSELYNIISFFTLILRKHGETYMRYFALGFLHGLLGTRYFSIPAGGGFDLFAIGLGDREPIVVMGAWIFIQGLHPEMLADIGEYMFSNEPSSEVGSSPEFQIARYIERRNLVQAASMSLYMQIESASMVSDASISISSFSPIHSLADYNPDPVQRGDIVEQKYELLKQIIAESGTNGTNERDDVMRRFLTSPSLDGNEEGIHVLVLPSGRTYLIEGHHRVAALIKAAEDGTIPQEWLDHIPVTMLVYRGNMPEALIRRVLTLGVDLTWADLFPPRSGSAGAAPLTPPAPSTPPASATPAPSGGRTTASDSVSDWITAVSRATPRYVSTAIASAVSYVSSLEYSYEPITAADDYVIEVADDGDDQIYGEWDEEAAAFDDQETGAEDLSISGSPVSGAAELYEIPVGI